VGDRDAPFLHQSHPGTFEHLRHMRLLRMVRNNYKGGGF
jgi:hypothetical protein